jgi:hypothetical protein
VRKCGPVDAGHQVHRDVLKAWFKRQPRGVKAKWAAGAKLRCAASMSWTLC